MIKLLPGERETVQQYIYSICAISLDPSKEYLIESRLSGLMEETRCPNFNELVRRARADSSGALARRIIDEITTNETLFFRDASPFNLLRHKLIPELIDRRSRPGLKAPIRIWSAACSTGQEPYSIAIVLKELLGDVSRFNIRLVATDISDQAISRASRGVFGQNEIERGLGSAELSKYFSPYQSGWRIRDDIRAMVTFRRLNLMEDFTFLGKFDVVFCRNVAIYFSDRDRASLFGRIERCLESDGCLVIGSSEFLKDICPQFESKQYLRSIFYQIRRPAPSQAA